MKKNVALILFIVTVLLLSACMPIQDPAAMQADAAPQGPPTVIESAADVPRIALDEAKQHFDNGTALFVDARSDEDYARAHIAGAIHVPLAELENEVPKDQLIITYCT